MKSVNQLKGHLSRYYHKLANHTKNSILNFVYPQKSNAIFVWIPKTAGDSITLSLQIERFLTLEDAKEKFNNTGLVTFGHLSVYSLIEHGVISSEFHQTSEKFCVVRNPYDRFVSLLHYLKRVNRIPKEYKAIDLINDVRCGIPEVGDYNSIGISQCNTQVSWIENISLDTIIRFENLIEDFDLLKRRIGRGVNLIKSNSSPGRQSFSTELSNREVINKVNEYYEIDFKKFGYELISPNH